MLADTRAALRVLETSHPPVYYLPPQDVRMECLVRSPGGTSFCEWKGSAAYYDVDVGGRLVSRAAWYYPHPTPTFSALRDHLAFYPDPMDACYVDGERVAPQPGNFYGGWITSDLEGPFKGGAGTSGW